MRHLRPVDNETSQLCVASPSIIVGIYFFSDVFSKLFTNILSVFQYATQAIHGLLPPEPCNAVTPEDGRPYPVPSSSPHKPRAGRCSCRFLSLSEVSLVRPPSPTPHNLHDSWTAPPTYCWGLLCDCEWDKLVDLCSPLFRAQSCDKRSNLLSQISGRRMVINA